MGAGHAAELIVPLLLCREERVPLPHVMPHHHHHRIEALAASHLILLAGKSQSRYLHVPFLSL